MKNDILDAYLEHVRSVHHIPEERKHQLDSIVSCIRSYIYRGETVNLMSICTHNSRRSIFSQVWGHVFAQHFSIPRIQVFSGGTEQTRVYPEVVQALRRAGLQAVMLAANENSIIALKNHAAGAPVVCFSKQINHPFNPQHHFIALMTCSEADTNCPHIPEADFRFSLPYTDPKFADGTTRESAEYDATCLTIAGEFYYLFQSLHA